MTSAVVKACLKSGGVYLFHRYSAFVCLLPSEQAASTPSVAFRLFLLLLFAVAV